MKLIQTLNPPTFVSSFLNFVQLGVLQYLFTTQGYAQGPKWKKLMIHWNGNQEKTTSISLQFHRPELSRERCFTHFLNYGGLCKERSTKQVTDTFQRRALSRKIMETLKRSIFSFTIANLVNKGILYFLTTTDAWLEGGGGEVSTSLPENWKKVLQFWEVSWFWSSIGWISHLKCSF